MAGTDYPFLFYGQVAGVRIGAGVCLGRDFDPEEIYRVTIEGTSTNMLGKQILKNLESFRDDFDLRIEGPVKPKLDLEGSL